MSLVPKIASIINTYPWFNGQDRYVRLVMADVQELPALVEALDAMHNIGRRNRLFPGLIGQPFSPVPEHMSVGGLTTLALVTKYGEFFWNRSTEQLIACTPDPLEYDGASVVLFLAGSIWVESRTRCDDPNFWVAVDAATRAFDSYVSRTLIQPSNPQA